LSIASFEPHIVGVVNLINLCLESSNLAAFYFASSVSAVAAYSRDGDVPEGVTEDPNSAQGMGYARSKWVVEKLCQIASETTPVRAVVLRSSSSFLFLRYRADLHYLHRCRPDGGKHR
jgi:nucleoside-diphosphate-sugar epimerase